jgi:hypothetical protein
MPELNDTAVAMADPRPGDRYHEMYSFWVYVLTVDDGVTVIECGGHPSHIGDRGSLRRFVDHDQFRAAYQYKSDLPGYWVRLSERDMAALAEKFLPEIERDEVSK